MVCQSGGVVLSDAGAVDRQFVLSVRQTVHFQRFPTHTVPHFRQFRPKLCFFGNNPWQAIRCPGECDAAVGKFEIRNLAAGSLCDRSALCTGAEYECLRCFLVN